MREVFLELVMIDNNGIVMGNEVPKILDKCRNAQILEGVKFRVVGYQHTVGAHEKLRLDIAPAESFDLLQVLGIES